MLPRCSQHKEKEAKYYCNQCKLFLCSTKDEFNQYHTPIELMLNTLDQFSLLSQPKLAAIEEEVSNQIVEQLKLNQVANERKKEESILQLSQLKESNQLSPNSIEELVEDEISKNHEEIVKSIYDRISSKIMESIKCSVLKSSLKRSTTAAHAEEELPIKKKKLDQDISHISDSKNASHYTLSHQEISTMLMQLT